ncbi:MAG: hypothetical protein A2653_00565 [Candidatus Zambryskibacteria bacterium RIFCSPHIGHO2_01_FULL_43_25]|uniref:Type 4 fimbrial biogenesis protein PilX N-terminal domain-containing protein n=1 Tax=Candidatus Zambryskibacteria bacterium RIFCSPLOWO2_01_FULL_45_21 TaxID=1802761 RepID=A0A1G2U4I3_9BACT|nr:MAG: hypothetical protein A2653_00565 [Candidatus Zambryskibacteria bacterium RIFCSPHIGHO2_01_FULL_43_25]OHB04399.1 MAG: hypothetical protein A3B14_03090 [Candidatus Zambryskibacteria bacterium RIFCSPLOWO2_01_FULL_45_21]
MRIFNNSNSRRFKGGQIIIQVIIFSSIAVLLIGSLISSAAININSARHAQVREQAFQLAEAGIEYYRWHLAHAPTDYQDGTGQPGPYIHDVNDKDGNLSGQFSLNVIPPYIGSTLVRLESTGIPANSPNTTRTIAVEMAVPSLAKFAVVANSVMRLGQGTEVFGPIHSNGGIRFDGLAHNLVTSAQTVYDDPDHTGNNEFGVHTHVNIPPQTGINDTFRPLEAVPSPIMPRPDVFVAGRQFPTPVTDFTSITSDLAIIKSQAQTGGIYYGSSGYQGYLLILRTNDTVDVYRVSSVTSPPYGCTSASQPGWGTWSVGTTQFIANHPMPANGLIFIEDHVWVEGKIDGQRVTIASGRFPDSPSTRTSITVNNDLEYTDHGGTDVIALIAQDNINIGLVSDDDLRIDAALVAQNGRVGRYYYRAPSSGLQRCSPYHIRNSVVLYGMIATYNRYGFAYTDGTGYQLREINYDANLLYGPPPSFPLTSEHYEILSWEEL